ncbi:MAG: hypothetical protein PHU21_01680 [Elusimicrobia bacterium]|nr:hypothetical protein [Elusimicrobiota bacterium]
MNPAIWLAAALAASGAAAPAGTPERMQEKKTEDKALIEHPPVQWLKVYSLPIYRESWRLEGLVKSLDQDLPKVREVFQKVGAARAGAEEASGRLRRLTYRCPKESAKRALAELKKAGSFGEPSVREIVEPVSRAEVQGRTKALEADKAGHAEELSRMPAVSALLDEMLGHLRGVESALAKPEVEVTLHLVIKER